MLAQEPGLAWRKLVRTTVIAMAAQGATAVGGNQYGLDAELFTRGTGADQPRGESMVQKHLEKMQQEKENLAMDKLAALMPQMGASVRVLALKEAMFDLETALAVLRSFQSQNDEALHALHKKRKKVADAEVEAVQQAEEAAAAAAASSSSSSESSASDSGDRKRRKHDKKSKRSKDKKKKHKEKDKKKSKKEVKTLTQTDNFGRFGIIREADAASKHAEFTLWAIEVKKVNLETLGKTDERELLKDYMEDYNTGTFPHRKYYNLQIYEREKAAKLMAKHGKVPPPKRTALNDEEELRKQREEERQALAASRMQAAMAELQGTDKARDMREQELLRMQMQAAYKTGDKRQAEQIMKQLMTDDEKVAKGIIKWKKPV